MRIIRQPILHQGTFEAIIKTLEHSNGQIKAGWDSDWELVFRGEGVEIFHRVNPYLEWLRERLREYEDYLYRSLLTGFCGKDGLLKPRTRNVFRAPGGGFRQNLP